MSVIMERTQVAVKQHPIVFFDGVCGLCDLTVNRLLKLDKRGLLRFAPLQGETAERILNPIDINELKTLVVADEFGVARYSTAAVRILWHLGGVCRLLSYVLWLIPSPVRNWGYRFVSARRYSWFGKTEACRLPKPGEAARFLQ